MTLPRSDCKRGNGVNRKVKRDANGGCAWQGTPSLRSNSERSPLTGGTLQDGAVCHWVVITEKAES